jgi:hypothetical protein
MQVSPSSETPVLLSSRCETTKLSVFVDRIADPVDPWIIANSIVSSIDQDDLKIFVSGILKSEKLNQLQESFCK